MARKISLMITAAALLALCVSAAVYAADTGTVTAKNLNLRSTPTIEPDNIVARIQNGDTVVILEQRGEWMKVRSEDGQEGWAAAVYISREGNTGPDPEQMLITAQSIFEKSFSIQKNSSYGITEEYKEYNPGRVMDAHDLVDKAIQSGGLAFPDRALLLRGRCRTVIGWYALQFPKEFFARNKKEFTYNEVGANYIYNGADFKELLKRFPNSGLADDAAFELASLPQPGECEGDAVCMMSRRLTPFEAFFKKHPNSAYVAQAIEIINSSGVDYWIARNDSAGGVDFDRAEMLKLLDRYKAAVSGLRAQDRAAAYHAIADAWAALGKKEEALALYRKILADLPSYEHSDHVKKSIGDLKK